MHYFKYLIPLRVGRARIYKKARPMDIMPVDVRNLREGGDFQPLNSFKALEGLRALKIVKNERGVVAVD